MKKMLKLIICICIVLLGNLISGCGKNAGDGHTSTEGGTISGTMGTTDTDNKKETGDITTAAAGTSAEETASPTEEDTGSTVTSTGTAGTETVAPEVTSDAETVIIEKEDSPYYGKIAVAYGDSITHGTFTDVGDTSPDSVVEKKWCDVVSERLGFRYLSNYGQNGISVSSTSPVLSGSALSLGYKNLRGDAEVIMIAAGTNDFGTNVRLGRNDDTEDVSFCGGLNVLCRGLKERFPDAAVIFITPIDRKDSASNALGLSLDDYRRKIEEIAGGVYGFRIVDGRCTGFDAGDPAFIRDYMRDGVHPNREAHILYGEAVAKELLTVKK